VGIVSEEVITEVVEFIKGCPADRNNASTADDDDDVLLGQITNLVSVKRNLSSRLQPMRHK
jgi:hypothetical protein